MLLLTCILSSMDIRNARNNPEEKDLPLDFDKKTKISSCVILGFLSDNIRFFQYGYEYAC